MHEKSLFNFSLLLFVGPGSGIKDGRIRIRDTKKWSDPDQHPGSATLDFFITTFSVLKLSPNYGKKLQHFWS
jgi:hypothetical protein